MSQYARILTGIDDTLSGAHIRLELTDKRYKNITRRLTGVRMTGATGESWGNPRLAQWSAKAQVDGNTLTVYGYAVDGLPTTWYAVAC